VFRLTARKLLAAASALILAATLNPISSATAAGGLVVTFEQNDTSGYVNVDFDDDPKQQASSVVADAPDNAGRALKVIRGKASWAGTTIISDASKTLLKTGELFVSARVHSPKANIVLRMKIENRADVTQSVETNATEKSVLGWHTYTFDFSKQATGTEAFSVNKTYNMASMFFDFVQLGPQVTTGNQVFYVDDLTFAAASGGGGGVEPVGKAATPTLLTFEAGDADGALVAAVANEVHPHGIFGGGTAAIMPAPAGGNGTNALAITKTGQPWTGANVILDLSGTKRFTTSAFSSVTFNYYSPKAGPVVVELNPGAVQGGATAVVGWQTITVNFSTVAGWSAATEYDKVVIFPDFQVAPSNPALVYFVDNVAVNGAVTPAIVPKTKPANSKLATLSTNTALVGKTLTVSKGTWTGTAKITYTYKWYRCSVKGFNAIKAAPASANKCVAISGKTTASYKLTKFDKGKYVRAAVTASNSVGKTVTTTKSTANKVK
jgi:hypothetical protein